MADALTEFVRARAADRCEYCRFPAEFSFHRFQLDHIVARKHKGPTIEQNLAWSCTYCNGHKGSNIAGIDPDSRRMVRLFHPRRDRWADHFEWRGPVLCGRTPIARTTVAVLNINDPAFVDVRQALIENGEFSV